MKFIYVKKRQRNNLFTKWATAKDPFQNQSKSRKMFFVQIFQKQKSFVGKSYAYEIPLFFRSNKDKHCKTQTKSRDICADRENKQKAVFKPNYVYRVVSLRKICKEVPFKANYG